MPTNTATTSSTSTNKQSSTSQPQQARQSGPSATALSTKNRVTKSTFIATGSTNQVSKIRTTKVSFPVHKRKLDPEERKKLAQGRWKKAIRRVKVMLRFHIKLTDKDTEEKAPVKLAPTYKLQPDPGKKFSAKVVKQTIEGVLHSKLAEYEYSRFTAPKFAKVLSSILNDEMKKCDWPRYKFITNVFITENQHQGVSFTSRCVWDERSDAYATAEIVKKTFIAVACVHGVYLD